LRSGRGLEKKIDEGAPAQRRAFLFDLARDLDRFFGEIQQGMNVLRGKPSIPSRCRCGNLNFWDGSSIKAIVLQECGRHHKASRQGFAGHGRICAQISRISARLAAPRPSAATLRFD